MLYDRASSESRSWPEWSRQSARASFRCCPFSSPERASGSPRRAYAVDRGAGRELHRLHPGRHRAALRARASPGPAAQHRDRGRDRGRPLARRPSARPSARATVLCSRTATAERDGERVPARCQPRPAGDAVRGTGDRGDRRGGRHRALLRVRGRRHARLRARARPRAARPRPGRATRLPARAAAPPRPGCPAGTGRVHGRRRRRHRPRPRHSPGPQRTGLHAGAAGARGERRRSYADRRAGGAREAGDRGDGGARGLRRGARVRGGLAAGSTLDRDPRRASRARSC